MPTWGTYKLSEVRTVAVEKWLDGLSFAPATKAKIRNIMSAVFSHGIRHEWITFNPISKVRCSTKRLREPDVLTPEEFQRLLQQLSVRETAMVVMAGATDLRRSEMFALRWCDLNLKTLEVEVHRKYVRGRFGTLKTEASERPVALDNPVADALLVWRRQSLYAAEEDFLFPSLRLLGKKPLSPDTILKKLIRPALV